MKTQNSILKKNKLFDKLMIRKERLTDEEDKLDKEISIIYYDKFNGDKQQKFDFEKRRLEALKKYLNEQEENLTDLFKLNLI